MGQVIYLIKDSSLKNSIVFVFYFPVIFFPPSPVEKRKKEHGVIGLVCHPPPLLISTPKNISFQNLFFFFFHKSQHLISPLYFINHFLLFKQKDLWNTPIITRTIDTLYIGGESHEITFRLFRSLESTKSNSSLRVTFVLFLVFL